MSSVLIKMADINIGFLKVKFDLLKRWHPKVCKKKNPTWVCGYVRQFYTLGHCLASLSRASCRQVSSDPRDRIVYPIHKLMIDSYILLKKIDPFGQISLWKDLWLNFWVITANILAVQ